MMRAGQDNIAIAAGQQAAAGYANANVAKDANVAKETPLITRLAECLEQHNTSLATVCKRLGVIADRVVGSVPTEARDGANAPPAHCQIARVESGLSDYADGLRWLHGILERLERL
jgi:hypothetical protein